MIINIVKENTKELIASIDTESDEVILRNGYEISDYAEVATDNNKWHNARKEVPLNNVQVLNEYGCVVTYNYQTKKWKNTKGRVVSVRFWRHR